MTRARDPEAGLSLIETLVALAITGVMAGVTVLSLGMLDRGDRAGAEAMRLADRLRLAGDDALLSGGLLALVWDERGYRFLQWDAASESWRDSPRALLGAHTLPPALRLERADREGPLPISLDPPRPPAELRISGGGERWTITFDGLDAAAASGRRAG